MDALNGSFQASWLWAPPRNAPPGAMQDKLRAQQASCLLNKPSARHVLMGLHCLINLKLFFHPQLSLSATSFFSCVLYLFRPNPILCVVIPRDNQTDRLAGLRREPYWGCQIDTLMNLLSVCSFPNFACLRNSTKKMMFFFTKQRLDLSDNPGSDAVRGRSFNRFVSKIVFFISSLFRHLWDVLTPFKKSDSVHPHKSTLLLPCLSVSLFVVGNSLFSPSLPVRKVVACNGVAPLAMPWGWRTVLTSRCP
jgi:hypothetical protein